MKKIAIYTNISFCCGNDKDTNLQWSIHVLCHLSSGVISNDLE